MQLIPVAIDRGSPVPLYHQLAEQLTAAIESGRLQPGDAFENEVALAERLDLSRPAVRRAIAELVSRGLLVRRRDELTSLYDDMDRRGQRPTTRVLAFDPGVTNEVAALAIGLPEDTPLLHIERLRSAGDIPTAVMHNWLPPRFAELSLDDVTNGSLYAALRALGAHPAVAHQTIGARRPSARERKLLGLASGDPLLTMSRRAYAADGSPVEYGDHCYRFDQYAFDVTVYER